VVNPVRVMIARVAIAVIRRFIGRRDIMDGCSVY
jgi:hypothetical protein